ncbi:hypothetical protein [Micromonospora sp. WMMD708]|uniref:hypothetical protein n=1 Tax=Micromonospora sp. WMMD708 TaxID=3403464 RepID=UPI003BF5ED1C
MVPTNTGLTGGRPPRHLPPGVNIASALFALQASLLTFAAVSALYTRGDINAAVNDAAEHSGTPTDSSSIALKASYFHFEARLTLWYALFFAPALLGVALWVRTGRQTARVAALTTGLLSALCCCGSGWRLWLADEATEIDEALPAAFGRMYPTWVEVGKIGLVASFVPAIIATTILAFSRRTATRASPGSNP